MPKIYYLEVNVPLCPMCTCEREREEDCQRVYLCNRGDMQYWMTEII